MKNEKSRQLSVIRGKMNREVWSHRTEGPRHFDLAQCPENCLRILDRNVEKSLWYSREVLCPYVLCETYLV